MMKRTCFVTSAAALVILLGQSSQAFGYAEYYAWGNYNSGDYRSSDSDDSYVHYQSNVAGDYFVIEAGKSFAWSSGYADSASMDLGAKGHALSTPTNNFFTNSYMSSEASNRFRVMPGTSGLEIGDVTTLQLNIRLDGSLHAEATSYPGAGWAHAGMSAGLSIHDYSIQECEGEECYSPRQASFGASGEVEAYDVYAPYWGYSYASSWEESWDTSSNSSDEVSHRASGGTTEYGDSFHYEEGFYFDTGTLTLEFKAIVGNPLDIEAYISTYVDANQDAEAWADFSNTLALGLTPTVAGTQIQWNVGPQAVPLPGALPLLGSGLLGLIGLRRRRPNKSQK
jgi:hypothetical protein